VALKTDDHGNCECTMVEIRPAESRIVRPLARVNAMVCPVVRTVLRSSTPNARRKPLARSRVRRKPRVGKGKVGI
jgi:hypothetical protein